MSNWEANVRKVVPYVPGEQPKDKDIIKLNTNENPYPPSPAVKAAMDEFDVSKLRLYPDPVIAELVNAIADFYNSYNEMKSFLAEKGEVYPPLEFHFVYDIPSFLKRYAYAFSLAGLGRITGINERQLSHYINGIRKPSLKTTLKIEQKLKEFAGEIAMLQFIK